MSGDLGRLARELMALKEERRREFKSKALTDEELEAKIRQLVEKMQAASGAPTPRSAPSPFCLVCDDDTGWIFFTDTEGHRLCKRCSCYDARKRGLVTVFDMPSSFAEARLANYLERPSNLHAIGAAREVVAGVRRHLFLFGSPGSGKSRLAASIARELADRGTSGVFIRVPWLILLQVRAIDDKSRKDEASALLNHATDTAVVVLDDVAGGEKGSDYVRGTMTAILDRRFDRELCTIITSNLSLDQLSEFYNDTRIPSRIAGACNEAIELVGPDMRLSRPAQRKPSNMRIVDR